MTHADSTLISEAWPEARQYRSSVRTEFSLLVAGMMVAMMLVFGWVITNLYVTTVTHHVAKSLLVQARSYSGTAGSHIISGTGSDKLMLGNICSKLRVDNPDIYWAGITGRDHVFIAHTDMAQVMTSAVLKPISGAASEDLLLPGESMLLQGDTVHLQIPIVEGDITLGRLAVAASSRAIMEARTTSIRSVVAVTLVMMLVGIPIAVLRMRTKLGPLADIAQSLRQVDLGHPTVKINYTGTNEIGYLAESLRVMGTHLKLAQHELLTKERLAQEFQIAHDIQTSLLPREYPASDLFEFAGTYRSATEVGGDYYDFIDFDDGTLAFIVADVSGKSLPGMLVMLLTRDIVAKLAHVIRDPGELLTAVNRELHANIRQEMFVTMLFGVLDKQTGHCRFASAGHNSLVVVDGASRTARTIKTRGFPLGLVDSDAFAGRIESADLTLKRGDMLVLYTDGITEAQNVTGEQFGMNRFVQVVERNAAGRARDFVNATMEVQEQFVGQAPQYDDITLLALKWKDANAESQTAPLRETARVSA